MHHLDRLDESDEVQGRHRAEHSRTDVRGVRSYVPVPVADDHAVGLETLPPGAFVVVGHECDHHGQLVADHACRPKGPQAVGDLVLRAPGTEIGDAAQLRNRLQDVAGARSADEEILPRSTQDLDLETIQFRYQGRGGGSGVTAYPRERPIPSVLRGGTDRVHRQRRSRRSFSRLRRQPLR